MPPLPALAAPAEPGTACARETRPPSSLPPSAATGQASKTCAETSTTKATMATAISVAPDIALTR